jgi:hydroxyethylthiazole kinase-like sugar kinase family protein
VVLGVGAITAREDVFARFAPAKRARAIRRRFCEIEIQLLNMNDIKGIEQAFGDLTILTKAHPFRFKTLVALTYNEMMLAKGKTEKLLFIDPGLRSLAHIIP